MSALNTPSDAGQGFLKCVKVCGWRKTRRGESCSESLTGKAATYRWKSYPAYLSAYIEAVVRTTKGRCLHGSERRGRVKARRLACGSLPVPAGASHTASAAV